ncbi:MAG: phosphoglucosamine mutase [Candidatus Improbicoccus devescovinae]|nr:MAG: phosphoglucosamine mutase [Candidatus Improbicoccus devescovinae]
MINKHINKSPRLFGTDGVRGIANLELSCELALNIGRGMVFVLGKKYKKNIKKILIGKDTRISSDMLESAIQAGICSMGADVISLGIVPTPAVAFLVTELKADAAVMISASHNSFEFNGIKIFDKNGHKLDNITEDEIEYFVHNNQEIIFNNNKNIKNTKNIKIGKVLHAIDNEDYISKYVNNICDNLINIKNNLNFDFENFKILIDCANGSGCIYVEKLFEKLGVHHKILFNNPDGININNKCGSTDLENLSKFVIENKYNLGLAYDGDADRCIAIDETGRIIDGNYIMALCALELSKNNKLEKNTVVGTCMANLGLILFLQNKNINFVETDVGDRYILENMTKNNYNFGGEESGHIIFKDISTTGDGLLTSAMIIDALIGNNMKSSDILNLFKKIPEALINIKAQNNDIEFANKVKRKIAEKCSFFSNKNKKIFKLFVRKSGTEPVIRILVQSEDKLALDNIENFIHKNFNVKDQRH